MLPKADPFFQLGQSQDTIHISKVNRQGATDSIRTRNSKPGGESQPSPNAYYSHTKSTRTFEYCHILFAVQYCNAVAVR
jgi:hypothetical protein